MRFRNLTLLIASAALAGCAASGPKITFNSDPQGATLYQEGAPVGRTPVTLNYDSQRWRDGHCDKTQPMSLRWASGASANGGALTFCPAEGANLTLTIPRPDYPDRIIDEHFALQIEQGQAVERAASSAAASAASINLGAQLLAPPRPVFIAPPAAPLAPVNCVSQRMGQTVFTNCR